MAFTDDADDGGLRSGFSGKIVAFLLLVAGGLAVKFLIPALSGSARSYTPDRVRTEIESDPNSREMFSAIRASYPTEYDTFLQHMADTANATNDSWALRQQAFNFTQNLMRIHFDGLAKAPGAEVREIALQYRALFRTLHDSNVDLCARAATGGITPGAEVGPEIRAIINHLAALQIIAARHGEALPGQPRAAMNEAESRRFTLAVRARSEPAYRLMLDESAMAAASAEQQCQSAVVLYDVISALPPDDSAKATVQLLRLSMAPASPTR